MTKPYNSLNTLRWAARILGTLMVAFTLFFAIGSFMEGYNKNNGQGGYPFGTSLTITFVFWGIGLLGLIIALWREGLGGIISLSGMVIFVARVALSQKANFSIILFVFLFVLLLPPILYLAYWYNTRKPEKKQTP